MSSSVNFSLRSTFCAIVFSCLVLETDWGCCKSTGGSCGGGEIGSIIGIVYQEDTSRICLVKEDSRRNKRHKLAIFPKAILKCGIF